MTKINVSASVLQWALERSRTLEAVGSRFPKLDNWVHGETEPTLRQLEKLAKITSTPLGYFFLDAPPKDQLPIPYFRTLSDNPVVLPSPELLETVQIMERRQSWMREYLIEQGHGPLNFVRSSNLRETPEQVAKKIRRALGLNEHWAAEQPTWSAALRELQYRMEVAGILIAVNGIVGNNTRRKLDPAEFRGFVLVDEYAPLVFVNGADGKAAQMFTVSHEVAHIWLGSSAAFDLRELQPADDVTEQTCNRIAAEFLITGPELRELWPRVRRDSEPYQTIARHFKVSVLVAARRALDLQLITKPEFLDFYQAYLEDERRRGASKQDGGNFYSTQNLRLGRRFAETVIRAAKEGRVLYREAYQLTGLYGKTFERYAQLLGLGG